MFLSGKGQKVGDHGVKAKGDGWLLTVALIEGTKLAPVDATGFSDPYVVFTCNGKTKQVQLSSKHSNLSGTTSLSLMPWMTLHQ